MIYLQQGKQCTSFLCIIYMILHMKLIWAHLFGYSIIYRRKTGCTKCRCKRSIFHNICEFLKCCICSQHFDQIYHNIGSRAMQHSWYRIWLKSQRSQVWYPVRPHTFISPSTDSRMADVTYWWKYVHEVLVNCLGGLRLRWKSVVRLTDHPDMTTAVYHGRKTTTTTNHNIGEMRLIKVFAGSKRKS